MILLTWLLQSSVRWHDAEVTIKMVVKDRSALGGIGENLNELVRKIRIDAKTELIVSEGREFNDILHDSSKEADLILMGMAVPDENFTAYYNKIQNWLKDLPTVALVLAGEELAFGEILMQQDDPL
jgi:fructose-1-phosphate kinase PfkB-like protein